MEIGPRSAGEQPPPDGERRRAERIVAGAVPLSLQSAAALAWRIIVVGAAIYLLARLLRILWMPVLALAAALFVTALMQPLCRLLRERLRLPRGPAAAVTILLLLGVAGAAAYFVETEFAGSLNTVKDDLNKAADQFVDWLHNGPLHLSDTQVHEYQNKIMDELKSNQGKLTSIGFAGISSGIELLTGTLITLFTSIFLLYDGEKIWAWVRGLFPRRATEAVQAAGEAAWSTLTGYVRGTVIVAAIDATCICVGLLVLGVPLAVPLGVIVFLGSFIPLVGAVVTGAIAVLVALVTKGFLTALIVLIIVIAVQQIEGHVLQPFIMGRSVQLHPVAIVFAVTIGTTLAGVGGAVLAVPVMAVLNRSTQAVYRVRRAAALRDATGTALAEPPAGPPEPRPGAPGATSER